MNVALISYPNLAFIQKMTNKLSVAHSKSKYPVTQKLIFKSQKSFYHTLGKRLQWTVKCYHFLI